MRAPNYRNLKKQREEAKKRDQRERLAKRQPARPTTPDYIPESKEPA
jgi:hypothetical protein